MSADPSKTHVAAEFAHDAPLVTCRFEPKGRFVFSATEDRAIHRWDLATGQKTAVLTGAHDSWVGALAFTPDGETMISAGYDDTLIWWPAAAEKPAPIRKVHAHEGWIRSISMSVDGRFVASGGNDRTVKIWDAANGSLVRALSPEHDAEVWSVLFHPGGNCVLSGDLKGRIHQWETATGAKIRTLDAAALHSYNTGQRVNYGGVRSLTLSPDGKHLAAAGLYKAENPLGAVSEPLVIRFEWESGKALRSHVAEGIKGVAWRAAFHPDGFLVGCSGGSAGGFLFFWNAEQDKAFHQFKLPGIAREMDLHPDGLRVATAHYDKKLRICKLAAKA